MNKDSGTELYSDFTLQQSSQLEATRLTAEEIAETAKGPTLQEIMAHFGQKR